MGVFGKKKHWLLAQLKKNELIKLRYKKCNKIFENSFLIIYLKLDILKFIRIKMKNWL